MLSLAGTVTADSFFHPFWFLTQSRKVFVSPASWKKNAVRSLMLMEFSKYLA